MDLGGSAREIGMLQQMIDDRVDRRPGRGVLSVDVVRRAGDRVLVTASITETPGPVSKARTPSSCPFGGTTVTLPMPPMF